MSSEKFSSDSLLGRKLADIANTAEQQLNGGLYRISEWADLVTAHPVAGPEMVSHLFGDPAVSKRANCGVVLVTEMSTRNALTTPDYSKGDEPKLNYSKLC